MAVRPQTVAVLVVAAVVLTLPSGASFEGAVGQGRRMPVLPPFGEPPALLLLPLGPTGPITTRLMLDIIHMHLIMQGMFMPQPIRTTHRHLWRDCTPFHHCRRRPHLLKSVPMSVPAALLQPLRTPIPTTSLLRARSRPRLRL